MAEHCQPDVLFHHASIVPTMLEAMNDSHESVKGTACYVMEFFCENMQRDVLKPYLNPLLTRLGTLLGSANLTTVDMAIAAIAATAVAADVDFWPYTSSICEVLNQLIFITEPTRFQIRGRALECLGHIALGVGKERFKSLPYFERGMQSVAGAEILKDESLREFSYVFISNSVKAMGDDFVPILPQLVPILLDVVREDEEGVNDEDDEDYDPNDDDSNLVFVRSAHGFVNTKKAAVGALGDLAENCGEDYHTFLLSTFEVIAGESSGQAAVYSYHDAIRSEAMTTLPQLVSVVCEKYKLSRPTQGEQMALPEEVRVYVTRAVEIIISAIKTDGEKDVVAFACESMKMLLSRIGLTALMLQDSENKVFADDLMALIFDLLNGRSTCQIKVEMDETDNDENHDKELMDSVCDLIGAVAKAAGQFISPYFDTFYECLLKYCAPERSYTDRAMAIGCIGEVLRELGPSGSKFVARTMQVAMLGLQDSTEAMRRNSAYCVCTLFDLVGDEMVPQYSSVLQALYPICSRELVNETGAIEAGGADIDNAVGVIARMINTGAAHLPLPDVLKMMLSALPLKSDFADASIIYACLCNLVNIDNPVVTPLLAEFFTIFAQTLVQTEVDASTKDMIITTAKDFASRNAHTFFAVVQSVDPRIQGILQEVLAT